MQAQTLPGGRASIAGRTAAEYGPAQRSGVSWGAIFAGAAAAAALSLVLVLLGSGLGLSAISPWSDNSAAAVGTSTIVWIAFTQLAASAVGGYLAGRLRIKWAMAHTDEVYFRDTAHGLLAWAVATLLTAALLTGAVRAVMKGAIDAGTGVATATMAAGAGGAAGAATEGAESGLGFNPATYYADVLLRSDKTGPDANSGENRAEAMRIFANAAQAGSLGSDDRAYLARMVAARTGLAQADAEKRVDDVHARIGAAAAKAKNTAKEAADKARKAAAYSALWMTAALMLGAFVASLAATMGGRLRDEVDH